MRLGIEVDEEEEKKAHIHKSINHVVFYIFILPVHDQKVKIGMVIMHTDATHQFYWSLFIIY